MFSALFYLQYHWTRNRLVLRLKRLKQPKYLVGAIVGALYFYWYFFRVLLMPRGRPGAAPPGVSLPDDPVFYESLAALVLLGVVLLFAWVFPRKRAALAFTEAEVAFLFPAPITRQALIWFKLLRSQFGILVGVLVFSLISSGYGPAGRALIRMLGWWVILSMLSLHFLGASFARTLLLDRGIANWQRRVGVLALTALAVGVVVAWAARSLLPLTTEDMANADTLAHYGREVLSSGPAPWLLFPCRLVVRPFLAPNVPAFLGAIWPALLLLAAHYWWVMRADVAFEEASLEASQKLAEKLAAVRSGNWRAAGQKLKRKRPPFRLAASGPAPTAFLWKNLIAAGQAYSLRTWVVLLAAVAGMSLGLRSVGSGSGWVAAVAGMAAMFAFWTLVIGPQVVRHDFRQDLPQADVLKSFPLRGWQIALGEILAPAVILAGFQWLLLILVVGFPSRLGKLPVPGSLVVAGALGAAVVMPMLNLISLLIPNAAVLLFPAWFQSGRDAPQSIEATGQRIIFALGQMLAFAIALAPAAGVFTVILLVVKLGAGPVVAVLAAAVAAALVLAVEAGFGIWYLGWLFERFDVSAEPAA